MNQMKMIYNVEDRPPFAKVLICAFQQLLAILSATIAVPMIIGNGLSPSAALFGAGAGTLIYLIFTKFKSPVFLGSSFAFLGSMAAAFAGAVSMRVGYLGLILGAFSAGLVYVILAIVVKFAGTKWVSVVMPPVIIGPTVTIIGLSLAGNAIGDLTGAGWLGIICGLVTLFVTIICSVYGKKTISLIPFIIGIGAGYLVATLFTVTGAQEIIDFSKFQNMEWFPDFTFVKVLTGVGEFNYGDFGNFGTYFVNIFVAFASVGAVVFAEHLADHTNLSSIIGRDLIKDPGLHRTLLGDGVGSAVGAFFGGCPNTSYGEAVATVAISRNASTITIFCTGVMAMVSSFIAPFTTFLSTIPSCVMGGVCVALYGFIAVSGLKMLQKVDLNENKNLFVVSVILIAGIGGFALTFGKVTLTSVAASLILGILVNVICKGKKEEKPQVEEAKEEENKE